MSNLERVKAIAAECENDAKTLDGLVFNGKNVGVMFGNVLAACNALARTLEDILTKHPELEAPCQPSQ